MVLLPTSKAGCALPFNGKLNGSFPEWLLKLDVLFLTARFKGYGNSKGGPFVKDWS